MKKLLTILCGLCLTILFFLFMYYTKSNAIAIVCAFAGCLTVVSTIIKVTK